MVSIAVVSMRDWLAYLCSGISRDGSVGESPGGGPAWMIAGRARSLGLVTRTGSDGRDGV